MEDMKLGLVETKFAEIIWRNEPLSSGQLVALCSKELEWKKSTTYTVLKKLCERGIFQNNGGIVTSRIGRDAFFAMQSEKFVDETFSGSLPAFVAAFSSRKKLSDDEIEQLQHMIDNMRR